MEQTDIASRETIEPIQCYGLCTGKPSQVEILQRKADRIEWDRNHLAIYKTCPACGSPKAEWIRNEWIICFQCETTFTQSAVTEVKGKGPSGIEALISSHLEGHSSSFLNLMDLTR